MLVGFPDFSRFDPISGHIPGAPVLERRLSDLQGVFADEAAFQAALGQDDPLLYTVATVELDPEQQDGGLGYAVACLYPGRIGAEYYMTKGHYHAWRAAAEIYIGLRGEGVMLLQDEATGQSRLTPLAPNSAVYVPGHTAHRTMNTGQEPLVYLGVYPSRAGHDYAAIARRNFHKVVVEVDGLPILLDRSTYSGSEV